jgi:hypothetical protein
MALRMLFDDRLAVKVEKVAERMAKAVGFTPPHLIGKTEACMVVVSRAVTWNLDPFQVAMTTYQTPDGKVGIEGSLARAILEASGELKGAIRQEWYGDWSRLPRPSFKIVEKSRRDGSKYKIPEPAWEYWGAIEHGLGVRITATLASTGEEMSLDFDLVDAYPRNATTWPTRPKLQLLNPAIRAFAKMVRPSLLMGVHFADDQAEEPDDPRDVTPARTSIGHDDPMDRVVAEARTTVGYDDGSRSAAEAPTAPPQSKRPETPAEAPAPAHAPAAQIAEPSKRRPGRPTKAEQQARLAREIIAEVEATEPEYARTYKAQRQAEIDALPENLQSDIEAAVKRQELLIADEPPWQEGEGEPEPVRYHPETGEVEPEPGDGSSDADDEYAFETWKSDMRAVMAAERPEFLRAKRNQFLVEAQEQWGADGVAAVEEAYAERGGNA